MDPQLGPGLYSPATKLPDFLSTFTATAEASPVLKRLPDDYGQSVKGEQDTAELGTITDANHTCTNKSEIFDWQIFFFLMLTKEYVFVLRNFRLLCGLK